MLRISHTTTGPTMAQVSRQFKAAQAQAIRGVAFDVRDALVGGMREAFDRPKPFTLSAFRVTATGGDEPSATVLAMPLQARYLFWEIEGGERKTKGFEKRLNLFGGQVAIPTNGSARDQYGNMTRSFIGRILADTNTSGTSKRFFTGAPKGMPGEDGVWARVNGNTRIVKVLDFAEDAQYESRFHMSEIAAETVDKRWESQLLRAISKA